MVIFLAMITHSNTEVARNQVPVPEDALSLAYSYRSIRRLELLLASCDKVTIFDHMLPHPPESS